MDLPLLSSATMASSAAHARAFQQAQPFRHVEIADFLEAGFVQRLLADFPAFEQRHARNEHGQVGGKAVRMDLPRISPAYAELDQLLASAPFLDWLSRLTGIPELLYDPDYVGGGTHENVDGQALSQHVDFNILPGSGWHRRLNLIVYLNPEWQADWGGCLELHADPWDGAAGQALSFLPLLNRCVVFETSERSWHGFSPIRLPAERRALSRKSIAVYFYTRERPAAETAPAHGTIYVPEGMPAELAPGQPLSEVQYLELRRRFAQLRGQLKFMYRTELDLSAQLAAAGRALAEARGRSAFPLQGYAVVEQVQGYFPDGWAEARLDLQFRLTRPARRLRLEVRTPAGLAEPQQVEVRCGGHQARHTVGAGRAASIEVPLDGSTGQRRLELQMAGSWVPKADGASSDERALALYIASAELG